MEEPGDRRERLLRTLDSAERVTVSVYRVLLALLLGAVAGVVLFVVLRKEPGGGSQGEYFYFGVAVLLALGWILGQFAALRRRQSRVRTPLEYPPVHDSGVVPLEDGSGYARSWQIRIGGDRAPDMPPTDPDDPGVFTLNRSFTMPIASLPAEVMPDDATLDTIAADLDRGDDLDDICRVVQPAYRDWDLFARRAYRMLVEARLADRRRMDG